MTAPRLHHRLRSMVRKLCENQPELRRPFKNSVYTTATVNFGPKAFCVPHLDFGNDPAMMCLVTALGQFDYRRGGHLVLWDLKLVIEFPPGCTACLPSSLIRHSNLPIQPGDCRASLVQYAAGALFRWVDHGFKTLKTCNPELRAKLQGRDSDRFASGLDLFTTLEEFEELVRNKATPS